MRTIIPATVTRNRTLVVLAAVALLTSAVSLPGLAQVGGKPGAFARMGFGARGISMGNALSAVWQGELVGYYNPALLPFATERSAAATAGFMSLDRKLNFISFSQKLPPAAGLSLGIINAGVSEIDGRDADGQQTGALRTSENQVHLSFAARISPVFSAGVTLKLYYYQLYTDVASTTIGVDFGLLYRATDDVALSFTVRDINSRYKWDTAKLLGQSGQATEDRFPLLAIVGASWALPDSIGLVSAEVEISGASTLILRAGAEVPLLPELILRAGIDRIDMNEAGNGVRPAAGFRLQKALQGWTPRVSYAYVLEPFSPSGIHLVSLGVEF